MNILMVLTSHDQLGDSGHKTGFWLEEFAAPYYVLKDAGATITLASPQGGQPPIDPNSEQPEAQTAATERLHGDSEALQQLSTTAALASVEVSDYDAIFYPGGHGPLWDLAYDEHSIGLIESFWAAKKPVAAVCHAPAVLLNVKTPSGDALVKGRKVTGFSNSEEDAVGLTEVVPYLLEDALKDKGGDYHRGDDWSSFTCEDGLLVTGQNPASSEATAHSLLKVLNGSRG